jgi:hypothetical protein
MAQSGVILLGTLLLILSACRSTDRRGAVARETLVDAYLHALQLMDEQAMLLLVPETHTAQHAVQARIEQLGGHAFHQVRIDYVPPVHPQWARVVIRGVYTGSEDEQVEFRDEIILHRMDNRWYLMLGQDRNAVPPPPTSQP